MNAPILPRLIQRLEHLGLPREHHPFLLQDMAIYYYKNPPLNHYQINQRLKYLGWRELELDYRTFELMTLYLDSDEGLCHDHRAPPDSCHRHPLRGRYRNVTVN